MLTAHALRKHWSMACAVALAFVTLAVMGWRILHGIDLSDESFYVAIPARFAMGDKPFVDDLSIAQTAGLFLYPFVKAYHSLIGTSGIFLFVRALFVIFYAGIGWSVYVLARPHVSRPAALLVATACICFVPYGIPSLSYNTISVGLFSLGLFFSARWLLAEEDPPFWRSAMFWAGFLHGASGFSYPTLGLSIVAALVTTIALARGRRLRALVLYGSGGLSFGLVALPVMASAGLGQLRAMVYYTVGAKPSDGFVLDIIVARLVAFYANHPELLPALVACAIAAFTVRRWPRPTALALVLFPLLARGSALTGYMGSLGYVACFGLMGPVLALGLRDRRRARVLGIGVALPSVIGGLVWALSSGNGVIAAGMGLFPSAIVTGLILAILIEEAMAESAPSGWSRFRPALALAPAVLVVTLLQYANAENGYYRDGPKAELTVRIDEGPFWGLYTTPKSAAFLHELSADLRTYRGAPGDRLYCNVPASYVIADRRPLVAAVWIFASPFRVDIDAEFFLLRARPGNLIILGEEHNWVLKPLIAATTDLVVRRKEYDVLVYRGFGRTAVPVPATPTALALDTWHSMADRGAEAVIAYGWSWEEGWGRWSASRHAALSVQLPEGPAADAVVTLDLVAHMTRRVKRQRYTFRIGDTVLSQGEVRAGDSTLVELAIPAALTVNRRLPISLDMPDALLAKDGRMLGLGLKRVKVSAKAGG